MVRPRKLHAAACGHTGTTMVNTYALRSILSYMQVPSLKLEADFA